MPDNAVVNPRLQITDEQGRRVVPVGKDVFEIGRRTASDLSVRGTDVSRDHACIIRAGSRFTIKDHSSRCGTFVNGERTSERVLSHGDLIELGRGEAEIVFLLDDSPTHSHGGNASAVVDFRKITALLDGLRALGASQVLDEVLALVMDAAIDVTDAERGFIMLANDAGELEFKIGRMRGRRTISGRAFEVSEKIPLDVFRSGHPQMFTDLRDGNLAGEHMATLALGIRHVLCIPLRVVRYVDSASAADIHRPIGVLYLDSQEKGAMLATATQRTLDAVAAQASSAIESARLYREAAVKHQLERELELAAEIQRSLLPQPRESGTHFEVAAACIPCRTIGGDFFDYFDFPNGDFGIALGDVAGKGPSAALLTAMIQGVFASQVASTASPAALLATVNESLIRRSVQSRFATLLYGTLSQDGQLTYTNAGHNPPMLVGRDGVRRLETGGLILGFFPRATYEQETLNLQAGDLLIVFSDGVTEALSADGEEFGEERLLASVVSNRERPAADVLEGILSEIRSFTTHAAQHDDVTALVLRYRPD